MFGQPRRRHGDITIAMVTGIITAVAIAQTGSMVTEEGTFSSVATDFITVDIASDRLTSSHTSSSFTNHITLAMATGRLSISITLASDLGCISVSRLIPLEDGASDSTLSLTQNGGFRDMQSLACVLD